MEVSGADATTNIIDWAVCELEALFVPGACILYEYIEAVRDHLAVILHVGEAPASDVVPGTDVDKKDDGDLPEVTTYEQRQLTAEEVAAEQHAAAIVAGIVSGEPLTEQKSSFQAHLAEVNSKEDVEIVMAALLQHNKIRNATHNISAYRIWLEDRQTLLQDCDDDGESAAGSRLLHLLEIMGVRSVLVVVSRWYGGVKLGPRRFTIINNAARLLLEECGRDNRENKSSSRPSSRKK